MVGPGRFDTPLDTQLALLSQMVEDSEIIQAAVAAGHDAWEQLLELLIGAGWEEHRLEIAVGTAIDRGLIHEHALGRFRVVEWTR